LFIVILANSISFIGYLYPNRWLVYSEHRSCDRFYDSIDLLGSSLFCLPS